MSPIFFSLTRVLSAVFERIKGLTVIKKDAASPEFVLFNKIKYTMKCFFFLSIILYGQFIGNVG